MSSIAELSAPIIARYPVRRTIAMRFGDLVLSVRTNSNAVADRLADYFRYWTIGPDSVPDVEILALEADEPELPLPFIDWVRDPGKTGRKDAFADLADGRAVRKVRTGMQYLLGRDVRLIFGPCIRHDNQVINFVIAQYITRVMHAGLALCHAAGIVYRGRGLAVAGISGAGKSTLALHLLRKGARFTSNDRLLIGQRDGVPFMAGVPKQPRINPGTALSIPELGSILSPERQKELRALERGVLWELEEKYDADVGRIFRDDVWCLQNPASAFLILTWHWDANEATDFCRADLAQRPDLLAAITKPPGPFYEPAGEPPRGVYRMSDVEYLACLRGLDIYEAKGKVDFDAAVEFCTQEVLG